MAEELMMSWDTSSLPTVTPTLGEYYRIMRRRENRTQYQQAVHLDMNLKHYLRLERSPDDVAETLPPLGDLQPFEYYFILRRRAQISQTDIADRLGVSKAWVSQAELGHQAVGLLESFWNRYYYEQ